MTKKPVSKKPVAKKAPAAKAPAPAKKATAPVVEASPATVKSKAQPVTETMSKAQRALCRKWFAAHPNLQRPERWVGAVLPAELLKELGL